MLSSNTACRPLAPTRAAAVVTLKSPPSVVLADQADRLPVSKPSAKIRSGSGVGVKVGVAVGVLVGGTGISVGVGVSVGGMGVFVAVGVSVGTGVSVAVGGTGVSVAVGGIGVFVGGNGVLVGVEVGTPAGNG